MRPRCTALFSRPRSTLPPRLHSPRNRSMRFGRAKLRHTPQIVSSINQCRMRLSVNKWCALPQRRATNTHTMIWLELMEWLSAAHTWRTRIHRAQSDSRFSQADAAEGWRQILGISTGGPEHIPPSVPQVRTFTHSKLLDASLSDRLGSKPMRVQMANADERGAASHRTRYWRLRDADGSSRVLDLGAGSSATPPQPPPPVPALLRMPTLRRFVRDPKSIYATDFTNDAVSALA